MDNNIHLPSPTLSQHSNGGGFGSSNLHSLGLHNSGNPPQPQQQQGGLSNFLTELKIARENAILGNYEESLKKYKSAMQIVQK